MGPRRSETRHAHFSRPVVDSCKKQTECTWRFWRLGVENVTRGHLGRALVYTLPLKIISSRAAIRLRVSRREIHFGFIRCSCSLSLVLISHVLFCSCASMTKLGTTWRLVGQRSCCYLHIAEVESLSRGLQIGILLQFVLVAPMYCGFYLVNADVCTKGPGR